MSTAQEFKAAAARRRKTVTVEIDGLGTVKLRALSAGDAQRFQSDVMKAKAAGLNEEEQAFLLIARSWVDDEGAPWYPEDEGVGVARSLAPEDYNTIATAVLTLNGLSKEAVDASAKNSDASPGGSLPTDSPSSSDTPTSI